MSACECYGYRTRKWSFSVEYSMAPTPVLGVVFSRKSWGLEAEGPPFPCPTLGRGSCHLDHTFLGGESLTATTAATA